MIIPTLRIQCAVAILSAAIALSGPAFAQDGDLDTLYDKLSAPDLANADAVEREIWQAWSRSGSPTADFLLERARKALGAGEVGAAIGHASALVENAPDFAEGYNTRATAYFKAGLYGPAMADIRHALALNPRHFGAITGMALILEETGHQRAALKAYRASAEINPHREDVQAAITRLEQQLGETSL